MRVLLVDDEPLALRRLQFALREVADVEVVGIARDGDAALDEARRLNPDVIILDVEMPGRGGLAVAAELENEKGAEVIILSAFDRYAASAFEIEAVDYLLKPIKKDRLRQALDRARRRRAERSALDVSLSNGLSSQPPSIYVPDRNGGRDVLFSEIIWIEAAKDYALIHTRTRGHIIRITMGELAERLPASVIRVHRSAFVTVSEIRRWGIPSRGAHSLILSDNTEVPVGPSYIAEVRLALRSVDH